MQNGNSSYIHLPNGKIGATPQKHDSADFATPLRLAMKHHRISAQVQMAHLFLVHVLHGFQNLKGRKGAGLDTQKLWRSKVVATVVKKCWQCPRNTMKLMAKLLALLAMAMYWKCYETKQQNLL